MKYLKSRWAKIYSPLFFATAYLMIGGTVSFAASFAGIDFVKVGDAGNPGGAPTGTDFGSAGAVGYEYYIGKYEVTNSQYTAFLNSAAKSDSVGLWDANMLITRSGSDGSYSYSVNAGAENKPVVEVSFFDAARFANWVSTGDSEMGVYDMSTPGGSGSISRDTGLFNSGGYFALPTLDEWYKAAVYEPGTTHAWADPYWRFATRNDNNPAAEGPSAGTNSANYANAVGAVVDVGSYPNSPSYYGTFDQTGNVSEISETVTPADSTRRWYLGGSFNLGAFGVRAEQGNSQVDGSDFGDRNGFRLVVAIPEPSTGVCLATIACTLSAGTGFFRRRKFK